MDGLMMVERHATHGLGSYQSARHPDLRSSQLSMPYSRPMYGTSVASPMPSPGFPSLSSGNAWPARSPGQTTAHSTSYHNTENNKPSLPSLKMLLNETRTSPPATPQTPGVPLQALPREPNYDQATFKPPALYPNKRSRTDSGWYSPGSDRVSQAPLSTSLPYVSTRSDTMIKPRQYDIPVSTSLGSTSYLGPRSDDGRICLSNNTSPELPSQRQIGMLPRLDTVKGLQIDSERSILHEPLSAALSRSPSAHLQDRMSARPSPYSDRGIGERYTTEPQRQPCHPVSSYASEYRASAHDEHSGASYPYAQSYFVPSHYEYQNGKSRKRSNLPKQSTEIMKKWFDENMQNPYPSEEQKRHFAAVAGINLTQVSNWFINHRRRCPELREKRDKGRDGSRDDDL